MKNRKQKKTRLATFSLFGTILCGVLALCFLQNPLVCYICAGVCGVSLLTYIITLCAVSAKNKKDGVELLGLSFELLIATLLFTVLMPVTFILWIVEAIVDGVSKDQLAK